MRVAEWSGTVAKVMLNFAAYKVGGVSVEADAGLGVEFGQRR